jgi:intein/homing endonuclease
MVVENNKTKVVQMGEWIDSYLDAKENASDVVKYGADEAHMELLDISKKGVSAYIQSTDMVGNVNWHNITNVTRHDPGEYIYKIKTKWGREVSVVASKSLLVWNATSKVFEERNINDVSIGDKLPVTFKCPTMNVQSVVDVRSYLSPSDYLYGTDYNNGTYQGSKKKWSVINGLVYSKNSKRNGSTLPETFELDRDFGFFVGIYLAEGNTCKDYIGIANNDQKIRDIVQKWFEKHNICHRTQVKAFNPDRPGLSTSIRGYSILLVRFLEKFLGKYSQGKYVPHEAFNAPDDFVKGLIDGYISGDGCITDYHVVVSSVSKEMTEGVSQLLARFGIFSKVHVTQQKKNNIGSKNILPRYTLSVQSNYVYKFAETFTLSHDVKQQKLSKLAERDTLGNMSFLYEEQNDVILDKIVSIEKIDATSDDLYKKVYDITVPNTLNFQLFNGLQVRDTSETGYIQRRLVKAMEDCKIYYDQTVRNATGAIVQFLYGEDGMDGTKMERQTVPTIGMNLIQLDAMYRLRPEDKLEMFLTKEAYAETTRDGAWAEACAKHFAELLDDRAFLIHHVFRGQKNDKITYPIPFERILNTAQQRMAAAGLQGMPTDLTPGYILDAVAALKKELVVLRPNQGIRFLHILLHIYLSPKPLLMQHVMAKPVFDWVVSEVRRCFITSVAHAGEMVGIVAAQSLGELSTQQSCTKDTHIRVLGPKNYSGAIGTFIDTLMAENPSKVIDLGNGSTVMDLEENYHIVSVSANEKTQWSRIKQISRHPAKGGLVRVRTRSGRTTTATLSHSFLRRTPYGIVPVLGAELKTGDRIPIARAIPEAVTPSMSSITLGQLNKKTFLLDREFGWILGAYLADGSLGHGSVAITKMEPVFESNIKAFGVRYGMHVSVKIEDRQHPWNPSKMLKTKSMLMFYEPLQKWIESNFGRGSYNKRIPAWVYGCSDDFIAGVIAGYFDGDGNVNVPKFMIRAHSVNEGLIEDMIVLLAHCGIFAKKHVETRDREQAATMYVIQAQHKYAQQFADKIRLTVPYKRQGVLDIIAFNTNKNRSSDIIDMIPEVDDLLDRVGRKLRLPGQSRMYGKYKRLGMNRISRGALEKYVALFRAAYALAPSDEALDQDIRLLEQAAHSDVVWDEITELEYLPDPEEYVYDFTIPGNESFMVDMGVLVHNTLDSFHSSGTAAAVKATSGVPRLKELLSVSKNIKTPTMMIYLKKDVATVVNPAEDENGDASDPRIAESKERAMRVMHMLETTKLQDVLDATEVYWDPPGDEGLATGMDEDDGILDIYRAFSDIHKCRSKSPWVLRMKLNREKMYRLGLTMMDVYLRIYTAYSNQVECIFSDDNAPDLVLRIRLTPEALKEVDSDDVLAALKAMEHNLVSNILLKGMKGIKKVSMRLVSEESYDDARDAFDKVSQWTLDTDGTNLMEMLAQPNVDATRTRSNDIWEIYHTLGIEAARTALCREFLEVVGDDTINFRHMSLLLDTMTNKGTLMSVDRHGINRGDVGPLAKSSFEETTDMLINASIFSEYDRINGVSANIMLGQLPPCGTGDHEVLLDEDKYLEILRNLNTDGPAPREATADEAPELSLEDVRDIMMPYEVCIKPKKKVVLPEVTFA